MNIMKLQKKKDWFGSEEGQKSITDFVEKLTREGGTKTKQLERFHLKFGSKELFSDFTERVINKYNSKEYKDRYTGEPPKDLFWFLYHYARKYGRECNKIEYEQYGNMFTSYMFFCNGYYFNRMDGQGSIIQIERVDEQQL